jgi:hypothetical protein
MKLLWQKTAVPSGKKAVFPFESRSTIYVGQLYRPVATVDLWAEAEQRWERTQMIVDTGADYTILPRYFALLLGLKLEDHSKKLKTEGIGGEQTVYFFENIKVKLGPFERSIPVGFASNNHIPPLMGRYLFLETFVVEFAYNKTTSFSDSRKAL